MRRLRQSSKAPRCWTSGGVALVLALVVVGCASRPSPAQLTLAPAPHTELAPASLVVDGRARFRQIFCGLLARRGGASADPTGCRRLLWRLDDEPVAALDPLPEPDPTLTVYLVPGAFSECLGEEAMPFRIAAESLAGSGYRISTIVVSGRSGPEHNARQIADALEGEPGPAVLIGYSKGANDILAFLVGYPHLAARVAAVVGVAGAIGGSPLAESAEPVYGSLFSRMPMPRCRPGDGQVLASLQPVVRRSWLASNVLPSHVQYFSVAAFTTRENLSAGLVPSWQLLLDDGPSNDGQLLARDMIIPGGMLLGYVNADHWAAAIDVEVVHPILGPGRQVPPFPRSVLLEAILLQVAESLGGRRALSLPPRRAPSEPRLPLP